MPVISSWWVLQFYLLMSQIHSIYKIFTERKSDVTVCMKWCTEKHYVVNQLSSERLTENVSPEQLSLHFLVIIIYCWEWWCILWEKRYAWYLKGFFFLSKWHTLLPIVNTHTVMLWHVAVVCCFFVVLAIMELWSSVVSCCHGFWVMLHRDVLFRDLCAACLWKSIKHMVCLREHIQYTFLNDMWFLMNLFQRKSNVGFLISTNNP